jgi:hypothetical protein
MTSVQPHPDEMPAELTALLSQVVPPGGGFGHRQHVHLAFLAVREHGTNRLPGRAAEVQRDDDKGVDRDRRPPRRRRSGYR